MHTTQPLPPTKSMANTQKWGVIAEFDSASAIYQAAEQATAQGYTRVDATGRPVTVCLEPKRDEFMRHFIAQLSAAQPSGR